MKRDPSLFALTLLACDPAAPRRYRVRWRLENRSGEDLSLLETWIPHEKFKGEREAHSPPKRLQRGGGIEVGQEVSFAPEDAGLENSFVVIKLAPIAGGEAFRVFARLVVEVEGGRVIPRVVKVTVGV